MREPRHWPSQAVIADLTQIRSIGRWTAEMLLIFNLLRADILPMDEIGLLRAVAINCVDMLGLAPVAVEY